VLESNLDFRLIPCWNRNPLLGSFLDWKMLAIQEQEALKRLTPDQDFANQERDPG
jgi:hypothetical protein